MADVERPMSIPSQGRARPGWEALNGDQVRNILAFNEKVLANSTGSEFDKFKEPAIDPLVVINEAVAKARHDIKVARWKQGLGLGLSIPAVPLVAVALRSLGAPIEFPVEVGAQ